MEYENLKSKIKSDYCTKCQRNMRSDDLFQNLILEVKKFEIGKTKSKRLTSVSKVIDWGPFLGF